MPGDNLAVIFYFMQGLGPLARFKANKVQTNKVFEDLFGFIPSIHFSVCLKVNMLLVKLQKLNFSAKPVQHLLAGNISMLPA